MTATRRASTAYTRTRSWAETVGTRRLARLERAQRRRAELGDLDAYGTARWLAMRAVLAERAEQTDLSCGGRG